MKNIFVIAMLLSSLAWAQNSKVVPPQIFDGNTPSTLPLDPGPHQMDFQGKPEPKLSAEKAFLVVNSKDPQSMKEIINGLKKEGISVLVRWPTHCALIKAVKQDAAKILSVKGVEGIYFEPIAVEEVPYQDRMTVQALTYWNRLIRGEFDENVLVPGIEPPKNDAIKHPDNILYQSDFMFGDVAACIFLPESDGSIDPNLENWAPTLRTNVVNEVVTGLAFWATWASNETPPIGLTFTVYYYDYPVTPTGYEPITHPYTDQGLWINDCMDDIGVPYYPNYFDRISWFNDYLKSTYNTDWAYSIFVANSLNDPDGCFSDGSFAYAYRGGPFLHMTYDNDGYGIGNMDVVCAHETGHIFWAWDEYASSGCYCSQSSNGYLNSNCENSCPSNVNCLMRSGNYSPCYYTKGHVGWDPGVYTLSDDITQSLGNPYPLARKYQYTQSVVYWAATGVRSNPGSDWDLGLYSDPGFGTRLASSTGVGVDFVVADYNHSPTGVDAVHVYRFSGTSQATVEYENGSEAFSYPNSYSADWPAGDVVEMIDYNISSPLSLRFTLDITSGSADLGFGIFRSNGSSYYAGRTDLLAWADANGGGVDETFTVSLPGNDWYGIIVWANDASSANYTINATSSGVAEADEKVWPFRESAMKTQPNPSRGELMIAYSVSSKCRSARLRIFDICGKLVREFPLTPGDTNILKWNRKDNYGGIVSEGVYFVCLEAGNYKKIEKCVLLK